MFKDRNGNCDGHDRHRRFKVEAMFAMPGGPFRRGGGRHGGGHGRGFGDEGDGRIGRFLMQGDLRLVVLALVEKEPRHGYEIIKHIEDLTYGFYAPSPGVIYPTLTYLEEAGYVVAEQEGNKKRYAITAEGQEHLDQNRSFAMTILDRLSQLAERMRQKQERRGRDEGPAVPRSVDAALLNLREVIARRLEVDDRSAGEIVRLLLQTAEDIDGGSTREQ